MAAGADVVALDATLRPRPGGVAAKDSIAALAGELTCPLLADVDSLEAGAAARAAGAHAVATTLAGYTGHGAVPEVPDLELVAALAARLDCPGACRGALRDARGGACGLDAGAWAVVVGTAITDSLALTRRFAAALEREWRWRCELRRC